MPAFVGNGGNKNIAGLTVGTAGGNKSVDVGWIGTATGNKKFFTKFSVSVSPTSLDGSRSGAGYVQTTVPAVVTVGGIGPFTYLWERVGGSNIISPTNSTSASTFFGANLTNGQNVIGTWHCTVTDTSSGDQAVTSFVSISLESFF